MKVLSALLTALLLLPFGPTFAQTAAPAQPASSDATFGLEPSSAPLTTPVTGPGSAPLPSVPPDSAPQLAPEPVPGTPGDPSLIPETQTTFVKPPSFSQKQERKSKTEEAEDELLQRIRFRDAKTKALRDPVVQDLWQQAQAARTDYEKRFYLQRFYKTLYDRMTKIDNRFSVLLAETRRLSIARVTQTKLIPSEPPAYMQDQVRLAAKQDAVASPHKPSRKHPASDSAAAH